MAKQERMTFLQGLGANPTGNGGEDKGPGPTIARAVQEFFNQAKGSGKNALLGAVSKTPAAKYKYMSIGSSGVGAAEKGARFTRSVGEFFCKLFRTVAQVTGHALNKSDLWHGHLIQLNDGGLCVVFHAKEYPKDLPKNDDSETYGDFTSECQSFRYRNVIWKGADNRIYQIDAGDYRLSEDRLITSSPLYDNVIADEANEWRNVGHAYVRKRLAARTLPQEEMGTQRLDLYYLTDESSWTWKSSHIIMRAMD